MEKKQDCKVESVRDLMTSFAVSIVTETALIGGSLFRILTSLVLHSEFGNWEIEMTLTYWVLRQFGVMKGVLSANMF